MPIIQKGQAIYPSDSPNIPDRNSRVSGTGGISVFRDAETDIELILAHDGKSVTIRAGSDQLELSSREWRGLYSGVLNLGPGKNNGQS